MGQKMFNIENDVIHKWAKKCIASKMMLYTNGPKSVKHRKQCYTQMGQKVYNIENDVIHKWAQRCITSKTMLYTNGTKSV